MATVRLLIHVERPLGQTDETFKDDLDAETILQLVSGERTSFKLSPWGEVWEVTYSAKDKSSIFMIGFIRPSQGAAGNAISTWRAAGTFRLES